MSATYRIIYECQFIIFFYNIFYAKMISLSVYAPFLKIYQSLKLVYTSGI